MCEYMSVCSSSCLHSQQLQVPGSGVQLALLASPVTWPWPCVSSAPPFASSLVKLGSQRLLPTLPAERTGRSSWGQRAPPNAQLSVSAQQGPEPASLPLWPQFPPFVKETEQHFLLRERALLRPHHPLSPQTKLGFGVAEHRHRRQGRQLYLSTHTGKLRLFGRW